MKFKMLLVGLLAFGLSACASLQETQTAKVCEIAPSKETLACNASDGKQNEDNARTWRAREIGPRGKAAL